MTETTVRLQAGWTWKEEGDDVVVSSPLHPKRLRVRDADRSARGVLRRLSEGVRVPDGREAGESFAGADGPIASALLRRLEELGAVVRRVPGDDVMALSGKDLYDRQIRFMSYFETDAVSGIAMNRRLQDACVMVLGMGGLGGWIALLLARLGVRHIVGVDPDHIELSNLHRQALYGRSDVGRLKVDAAESALRAADPDIRYTGLDLWINEPDDLIPFLDGVDLVINAFPYLPSFGNAPGAAAEAALAAGVPALNMPITHGIGPLTVPGETACVRCAWPVLLSDYRIGEENSVSNPLWAGKGFLAALAPRQAISAGVVVWEATRFLSGMDRARTLDGFATFDVSDYGGHRFVEVARNPDCELCGTAVLKRDPRRAVPEWGES
ncbi:ThiF family adenylyltransferase [Sphaerisporangium viridialbum]|uniref:ThiF family adenylyltransferase n=1 Tax=Sphaerisporangium viridialbum TaxID=46189 RepID=UPI003C79510F